MVTYKNSSTAPLKWLVAIIIFLLAMTVTWVDVEGSAVDSDSSAPAYQESTLRPTLPGLMLLPGNRPAATDLMMKKNIS